jgi:hypothetical protein
MVTTDSPTRRITRKQALSTIAGASLVAYGVESAALAATDVASESDGVSGVVLSRVATQGNKVDVLAERNVMVSPPGKERVTATAMCGDRPFVAGDRVVVTGQGDEPKFASPLYFYRDGEVERVSASECLVEGVTYALDSTSSYYWWSADGSQQWRSPAIGSPACQVGSYVGVYAIENVQLRTSTIYAIWLQPKDSYR